MSKYMKYIGDVLWIIALTLITQIGGFIYLLCIPIFNIINRSKEKRIYIRTLKVCTFCILYLLSTFFIVPSLASWSGRVPMPYNTDNPNLKQHNLMTVLLNRHYVTPQMRTVLETACLKFAQKHGDTTCIVTYLDCNFPFFDGFRLLPHLSHDKGLTVDLSFQYFDSKTKEPTENRPSWLGYGVCEEPKAGEEDYPNMCREKGFWQYNFMRRYIIPQWNKSDYIFDANGTRDLIKNLLNDVRVNFVLIEPHLKKRLGFEQTNKVRRPPCEAVRHDDHIHVAIY